MIPIIVIIVLSCLSFVEHAQSSCNVLSEGLNSDFLTVEIMPTTLPHLRRPSSLFLDNNPLNFPVDEEYCDYEGPFGLFTVGSESPGAVLCVMRGHITPVDDTFYLSTNPIVRSPGNESYALEPMSVCSMVNDCFDPFAESYSPGCNYNAKFQYVYGQHIILVATQSIGPDQEIFASYGYDYWRQKTYIHNVANISVFSKMPLNIPLPASAKSSEYISLYEAPSLLPVANIGVGLFAKYDIPAGTMICEYRGDKTYFYPTEIQSDKFSGLLNSRNRQWISIGVCPCACSNDAAHVVGRTYSRKEYSNILEDQFVGILTSMPTMPGFSYNSLRGTMYEDNVKSFIIAIKNISAGAEILNHFGISYWNRKIMLTEEN